MPKVLAGSPVAKLPACNEFYDCFPSLRMPEGSIWRRVVGGNISRNLNELVDVAEKEKCSHLFIVEDDSIFGDDTVMRLLKHDKPVVTGLCRARHFPFRPYIYSGLNQQTGLEWYFLKKEDKGLIKCAATGLGGILINTDVFSKLKRPYFSNYFVGENEWSQDIVFGKSLIEAGIKVYCDTDVIIGHITQCMLGSKRTESGWQVSVNIGPADFSFPQPEVG